MALCVRNKDFLSLLHKLDIDINQFPDKTFDGLFVNATENLEYFFSWIVDNVTPENVLTKLEEGTYFELEKNDLLPTDKEVEYVLSSFKPTYEELQSLDVDYIDNVLSEDLQELKKANEGLVEIEKLMESNHANVKREHNSAKEKLSESKKQLNAVTENCNKVNSLLETTADAIKAFLLQDHVPGLDSCLYLDLLREEDNIYRNLHNCNVLEREILASKSLELLPKLEENYRNVETLFILSRGLLQAKEANLAALSGLLQTTNHLDSIELDSIMLRDLDEAKGQPPDCRPLETELGAKVQELTCIEVQRIMSEYFAKKRALNDICIAKMTEFRDYVGGLWLTNEWLHHIMLKFVDSTERSKRIRDECLEKLGKLERNFNNNVRGFELRKQKFGEVSSDVSQHPFLTAVREMLGCHADAVDDGHDTTLRGLSQLVVKSCDDHNFTTHKFRMELQSLINSLIRDVLYGPTSDILYVPISQQIDYQRCQEQDQSLSQEIKRVVNKYLEAKESVSKTDRKGLLLWIDFLTNPSSLAKLVESGSTSAKQT